MSSPLGGLRVVELASIGPGPHAGMILADLGADVVRVGRPDTPETDLDDEFTRRRRTAVRADLKAKGDRDRVIELARRADVLIEGLRPGTCERLGLGPEPLCEANPTLIYARMTGWGQTGPLASTAGHDINYISVTGALHAIGPRSGPVPPINFVGDYGGGSMFLLVGILAALFERNRTGKGQILDIAMVDGVAALIQPILELRAAGIWNDERSNNILDGAAPFYRTYRCADGGFVAVGAIEPQFYAELLVGLHIDVAELPNQLDPAGWPGTSARLADVFITRSRDDWAEMFAGTDACVTPVLSFAEAPRHPQVAARASITTGPNGEIAGAAPRFGEATTALGTEHSRVRHIELANAVDRWDR